MARRRTAPRRTAPPPRRERDPAPSAASGNSLSNLLNYTTLAVLLATLILGIGIGVLFSSNANFSSGNVASVTAIDRSVPNPEFCAQFGASAVTADMRVYLTFNPFSVYVTQPSMQPGCVMRRSNWSILEKRGLVTTDQVRDCKNRLNTFAFVGNLEASPRVDCIYQNDLAGNLFNSLERDGGLAPNPDTDDF